MEKRASNNNGPPPSPFMLMGPPSPFPQMNGHNGFPGNMSPMIPGSPFGMGFPSPGIGGPSRNNMPHPHMYPSPLLHPNAHALLLNAANGNMNMLNGNGNGNGVQQNTSPFRRTSNSDPSTDVFAGPLTPGVPSSAPYPYPYELGHGFPPTPMGTMSATDENGQTPPLEPMSREARRSSIEASVLRKKSGHFVSSQEGPEVIAEEKEGEVIGLGMGEVVGQELGSTQEHELQSRAEGQEQEETGDGDGEGDSEHQEDESRSSLSPPHHFGNTNYTSNSGSTFTSNPPTPSPQSRLLTPSHLPNIPLAEEMGSSRSSSSAYDVDTDKRRVSLSSSAISEGNAVRPESPTGPLWVSDLNPGQLAQRKALAARREQRELAATKKKEKGERAAKMEFEAEGKAEKQLDEGARGDEEINAETQAVEV